MPDSANTKLDFSGSSYRGRFAPSPTGPLHMGSLIAALASYLDARRNNGTWLVRMDDLDPPREIAGAAHSILQSLQQHGLQWDEDVLWQSNRGTAYDQALSLLKHTGNTFACSCSRAELGPGGNCQGLCQQISQPRKLPTATRIAVPGSCNITIADKVQGLQTVALGQLCKNFLIHRKDGLYAYQLAVVVDDAFQGVTHVVRGSDLLDTTARQIFLQQSLDYPTPTYSHIPVITNSQGQKFSKQNHAPALIEKEATANLRIALQFLQQTKPPSELGSPATILNFASCNWVLKSVPTVISIPSTAKISSC